ncbi:hypothetical protein FIC_01100 [Flavobacteriaceae bacterium 3519-10]|nr:hypothetical protein FIC_01100 [Flavobacteriaceae bacterium 3519-10]
MQLGEVAEIEAQGLVFHKNSLEERPFSLALSPTFSQTAAVRLTFIMSVYE